MCSIVIPASGSVHEFPLAVFGSYNQQQRQQCTQSRTEQDLSALISTIFVCCGAL